MWDAILGWITAILGGLALGVLGNLLTPWTQRVWATSSAKYRRRRQRSIISRFRQYTRLHRNGSINLVAIYYMASYAAGMVVVSFILTTSLIMFLFWISKNTTMTANGELEWIYQPYKQHYVVRYLLLSVLAFSAIISFMSTHLLLRTSDMIKFAYNPQLYLEKLLEKFRKLDKNFDETDFINRIKE